LANLRVPLNIFVKIFYLLRFSEDLFTDSFKPSLYKMILSNTHLSCVPMIWAARIPAFFAQFKATVATGTPPGICKMDKTESQPSIELLDFIGTPITGSGDMDATIPGK
jgi:hypothetical protein